MVNSEEEANVIIALYNEIVLGEQTQDDGITKLFVKDGYQLEKVVDMVKDYYGYCTEIEAPWRYILQNESGEQSDLFLINEDELEQWEETIHVDNVDNEMELREQGEIADFYATITTLFLRYLKSHSFFDDVIKLELLGDVNMEVFMKRFVEEYQDHVSFDRMVIVEFIQGGRKSELKIN